jgi:hypothetical protein
MSGVEMLQRHFEDEEAILSERDLIEAAVAVDDLEAYGLDVYASANRNRRGIGLQVVGRESDLYGPVAPRPRPSPVTISLQ